jgi:hypothetical protein
MMDTHKRDPGQGIINKQHSELISKVVLMFEMQGIQVVEQYAKANAIPLAVCPKIVDDYLLVRSTQI